MLAPYHLSDGQPQLTDSVVLYLDILGSREMASGDEAQNHLERLFSALNRAREYIGEKGEDKPYKVRTFTDNLVMGCPVSPRDKDAEGDLGLAFQLASYYQFELATHGLFVRGAITRGLLYMDDDFVFGPGLVEAYRIENSIAIQPRIVLSRPVVDLCWEHTRYYGGARRSPQDSELLVAGDDEVFLNYLDILGEDDVDVHAELRLHKAAIEQGLARFSESPEIWQKYCWLADYHNYACTRIYRRMKGLVITTKTPTAFRTLSDIEEQSQ